MSSEATATIERDACIAIADAIFSAWSYRHLTANCRHLSHEFCFGYIAPLVYGPTQPCDCHCHAYRGRDYSQAEARATTGLLQAGDRQ